MSSISCTRHHHLILEMVVVAVVAAVYTSHRVEMSDHKSQPIIPFLSDRSLTAFTTREKPNITHPRNDNARSSTKTRPGQTTVERTIRCVSVLHTRRRRISNSQFLRPTSRKALCGGFPATRELRVDRARLTSTWSTTLSGSDSASALIAGSPVMRKAIQCAHNYSNTVMCPC